MTPRIGVFVHNLSKENPGESVRIARSWAEEIARIGRFETYAITNPFFDLNEIMVEYSLLSDYLDNVSLEPPMPPSPISPPPPPSTLRELWLSRYPWLDSPPLRKIVRPILSKLGFFHLSRTAYCWLHGSSKNEMVPALQADHGVLVVPENIEKKFSFLGPVSLEYFHIVLSFDPMEEIWNWPVENILTKTVGFFYDAMHLRIQDASSSASSQFFRATGNLAIRADRIICPSLSAETDIRSFFPASKQKTSVIPPGVCHTRSFHRSEGKDIHGEKRSRRILVPVDMEGRCNVRNVYRAMMHMQGKFSDGHVDLVIVGSDHQRKQFSYLEEQASRFAKIIWTGNVFDRARQCLLDSADVFLFPALWEGFGLAVLDAMSSEVPVVCSNLGSLPEICGEHARYFDPYDPISIAMAVLETLGMTADQRLEWVNAAKNRSATFSWKRASDHLTLEIMNLIDGPEKSTPSFP